VISSADKSAYKCDSCKKLSGDAANVHSFSNSNQKEALSTETQCTASCIGDKVSLCVQLEAVCVIEYHGNGTVSHCDGLQAQQRRIENEAMKTQLRELQQSPSHVPLTQNYKSHVGIALSEIRTVPKAHFSCLCVKSSRVTGTLQFVSREVIGFSVSV
jgi:hypothetical protein